MDGLSDYLKLLKSKLEACEANIKSLVKMICDDNDPENKKNLKELIYKAEAKEREYIIRINHAFETLCQHEREKLLKTNFDD